MNVRIPKFPSADYLESASTALVKGKASDITLDLREFRRSRLFAESRLLGLLVMATRQGIPVYVKIGSAPFGKEGDLARKYSKSFLESIFGLIAAILATKIADDLGHDYTSFVRDQLAVELGQNHGLIGSGTEVAATIIDQFGQPAPAQLVVEDDLRLFTANLKKLLFQHLGLLRCNEEAIQNLSEYAFETLQNTRDHGSTDLENRPLNGIRFLSVRRVNLKLEGIDRLIGDNPTDPIASYLKLLKASLFLIPKHLVEMTIADSGVGIPARMSGSLDIYRAPLEQEQQHLLNALQPTGTSKPKSMMGAGLGLHKVMQASHDLKGLIVFRTGRSCMYKHFTGTGAQQRAPELFSWANTSYELVAGTSVSLIFPWTEAAQLELG